MIDKAIKRTLLRTVRAYLRHRLLGEESASLPEHPFYRKKCGIFVTLHKHGELRGCIGYIEGIYPLSKALFDMAESAAFRDPRFPPLKDDELADIDIEISLLSEPEEIPDFRDILLGKHGIILKKGLHQAVFLPQVAPEQGWDLETTLQHLCMKAGLPVDSYRKPDCRFFVFTAEVFSENNI
jgi:AmmeMemoRadiSam system protein A